MGKGLTVPLVLLRNVRLFYTGPVSGKVYPFGGAGSVVEVDEEDVPAMLAIRKGHSCCGGVPPQPMFELAKV